jgi:heptose-I-phosphate ethanolaminephosphotransferase
VRAYLLRTYGAAPDSSLVVTAAANATPEESWEYLRSHARQAFPLLLAACGSLVTLGWALAGPLAQRQVVSRRGWMVGLLVLALLPYALKPSRRLHPAAFWVGWTAEVRELQGEWRQLERQRAAWLARARDEVQVTQAGPSTVVVVLTDSVNRDNLQIYGYPRATSPDLAAHQARLGGQWVAVKDAWSTEASTVPALQSMWLQGQQGRHHLLALARAAGYKVWWISNHDDLAVKNQHGRLADALTMLNRVPGRSTRSLDDVVLPALDTALRDAAPRKLVVLHILGVHQHYHLRYPEGANLFEGANDAVRCDMKAQGRPAWLQRQRDDYDAALRFHTGVVARALDATVAASAAAPATWVFVSDHGQEVGHTFRHAGHSPSTASGYRIPLVMWRSPDLGPWPADLAQRPFRADAWGPLLGDLLGLSWPGAERARSLLSAEYRWEPPPRMPQWRATAAPAMAPACARSSRP